MPVISFASSKGGAGKSTSALILATELAEATDVVLIDADPRRPAASWAELQPPPVRLRVVSSKGENSIQDEIDDAARQVPFIIVDLEGSASRLASFALAQSDLVVIPAREQRQDTQAAIDTLAEVKRAGRAARRDIPAVIVITQGRAAVKSRNERFTVADLRAVSGVSILETELPSRDAFASLWTIGGDLRSMDQAEVSGVPKAIANAEAFAGEIVECLREATGKARATA